MITRPGKRYVVLSNDEHAVVYLLYCLDFVQRPIIFITLPLSLNAVIASNGTHWSYVTLFDRNAISKKNTRSGDQNSKSNRKILNKRFSEY